MSGSPDLILASASPRRAELLAMLGLDFRVEPADIDESSRPEESAEAMVERLSREKAAAVADRNADALVFAGDTVVVLDDEILGKPNDEEEAVSMLLALAGRTHTVVTGLAVAAPGGGIESGVSRTEVTFSGFDEDMARSYVATGEPMDKAGAYGIQGLGATLVERIDGDYFTVVGLSISLLVHLLTEAGYGFRFGRGVERLEQMR